MDREHYWPLAPVTAISPRGAVVTYRHGAFDESAILVQTVAGIRAWLNRCRHLALPLDRQDPGRVFDREGNNLVCQEHGAIFEPGSGRCLAGPCEGAALRPLPVVISGGWVYLDLAALPPPFAP